MDTSFILNNIMPELSDQEKLDAHYLAIRTLRANIKRLRLAQKLNQRQLAKMAGVQGYQICMIEGSNYENPKIETLCRIAAALGVTLCDLFCEYCAPTVK